ncbi:carbohydrate sulfotransferase 11 [Lingula anatina]|uniref:Carbohydrate sulfotransferase n=1 Tax=Lingula anatina TaxID=7574 RepID=A0A1S3JAH2_LINAN|nr:carbohydrate sulfotransferase 11 [Lingula anatina]|eukprot:XP_013407196.1 carbohydrate sulfotransferase 11 [Lingula anatina]
MPTFSSSRPGYKYVRPLLSYVFRRRMLALILAVLFLHVIYRLLDIDFEALNPRSIRYLAVQEERSHEAWLQEIQRRKDLIKSVCLKYNMYTRKLGLDDYKHLFAEDNHQVLFCRVPTICNTNWKRVLLIMSGKLNESFVWSQPDNQIHYVLWAKYVTQLNTLPEAEIEKLLKSYLKFFFLRNPFERLLSSYRTKVENFDPEHPVIAAEVGNYVLVNYRKMAPIFPERKQIKLVDGVYHIEPSAVMAFQKSNITFEEFLRYVADHKDNPDRHWDLPHSLCHPCGIEYDVVGYYDTIEEDARNILKMAKADPGLVYPPRTKLEMPTSELMPEYYGKVSEDTLSRIRTMYEVDADMANAKI